MGDSALPLARRIRPPITERQDYCPLLLHPTNDEFSYPSAAAMKGRRSCLTQGVQWRFVALDATMLACSQVTVENSDVASQSTQSQAASYKTLKEKEIGQKKSTPFCDSHDSCNAHLLSCAGCVEFLVCYTSNLAMGPQRQLFKPSQLSSQKGKAMLRK